LLILIRILVVIGLQQASAKEATDLVGALHLLHSATLIYGPTHADAFEQLTCVSKLPILCDKPVWNVGVCVCMCLHLETRLSWLFAHVLRASS